MKKQKRTMKYLQITQWIPFTLKADDVLILKWLVDSSYAMHNYYAIPWEMVSIFQIIWEENRYKYSTKDELVNIDDMMPIILWTICFMEVQGYHTKDNIVSQDNQSTMLLSRNGKASRGKRTKHIIVRYLFITDIIFNREMSVEYLPTDDMLGNFFIKPTYG